MDKQCFCYNLKQNHKPEQISSEITVVLGKKNNNCSEACKNNGRKCQNWALEMINDDKFIKSYLEKDKNSYFFDDKNEKIKHQSIKIKQVLETDRFGLDLTANGYILYTSRNSFIDCDYMNELISICPCL